MSIVLFLIGFAFAAMGGMVAGKAGFSPGYGLLVLIPFINIIAIYLLAFPSCPA